MKEILLSQEAFFVYSSFYTNVAAGWFLTIFASGNIFDLTGRLLSCTIALYLAILLQKKTV